MGVWVLAVIHNRRSVMHLACSCSTPPMAHFLNHILFSCFPLLLHLHPQNRHRRDRWCLCLRLCLASCGWCKALAHSLSSRPGSFYPPQISRVPSFLDPVVSSTYHRSAVSPQSLCLLPWHTCLPWLHRKVPGIHKLSVGSLWDLRSLLGLECVHSICPSWLDLCCP